MKSRRIDIASIRREEIVEAAMSVITERGLQALSLSEIEKRAGMSRGQLTYYFPAKEDILLAVFDRVVALMHQRIGTPSGKEESAAGGWEWVRHLLHKVVTQPPVSPEFGCLQYTFLSQIGHRKDFRKRLATLYESWRTNMAQGLAIDLPSHDPARRLSPRALASVVQALLHGLIIQREADPDAFDADEMADLCLDMLGTYIQRDDVPARRRSAPVRKQKVARHKAGVPTLRKHEVNGERAKK
jgi:AcrR family transcriptional regulator